MAMSRIFVPVLSREAIKSTTRPRSNFEILNEDSSCDNVLLGTAFLSICFLLISLLFLHVFLFYLCSYFNLNIQFYLHFYACSSLQNCFCDILIEVQFFMKTNTVRFPFLFYRTFLFQPLFSTTFVFVSCYSYQNSSFLSY